MEDSKDEQLVVSLEEEIKLTDIEFDNRLKEIAEQVEEVHKSK